MPEKRVINFEIGGEPHRITMEVPDGATDAETYAAATQLLSQMNPSRPQTSTLGHLWEAGKGALDALPRGINTAIRGVEALPFADSPIAKMLMESNPQLAAAAMGARAVQSYKGSAAEKALAANPGYEDSTARGVGSVIGGAVPYLALGATGAGLPAMAALGALQGAGSQGENIDAQRAVGEEISPRQENMAALAGAGIGAGQALALGRLAPAVARLAHGAEGVAPRTVVQILRSMGTQAGLMGAAGGLGQIANNATEGVIYNPDKQLMEGAGQAALTGALGGAALDGAVAAASRGKSKGVKVEKLADLAKTMERLRADDEALQAKAQAESAVDQSTLPPPLPSSEPSVAPKASEGVPPVAAEAGSFKAGDLGRGEIAVGRPNPEAAPVASGLVQQNIDPQSAPIAQAASADSQQPLAVPQPQSIIPADLPPVAVKKPTKYASQDERVTAQEGLAGGFVRSRNGVDQIVEVKFAKDTGTPRYTVRDVETGEVRKHSTYIDPQRVRFAEEGAPNGNEQSVNDQTVRTSQALGQEEPQGVNGGQDLTQALKPEPTPHERLLAVTDSPIGEGAPRTISQMREQSGLPMAEFDRTFLDLVQRDKIAASKGDQRIENMIRDGAVKEGDYVVDPKSGRPYLSASLVEDAAPESLVKPVSERRANEERGSISGAPVAPPEPEFNGRKYNETTDAETIAQMERVMGATPKSRPIYKVIGDLMFNKANRDQAKLELVQNLYSSHAALARNERLAATSEHDLRASNSATAAAEWADRHGNVFVGSLTEGHPVYKDGRFTVEAGEGKTPMLNFMKPLFEKNLTNEFMAYAMGMRGEGLMANGRENLMKPEDISRFKQFGEQHPEIKSAFNEYQNWNKSFLKLLVDSGRIDQATANKWSAEPYIPFYRVIDAENGGAPRVGGNIAGAKIIPKLKGGTQQTQDMFQNMLQNAMSIQDIAMRTVAANRAARDAVKLGMAREMKAGETGQDVVTVYENGKAKKIVVEDRLTFEAMTKSELPPLGVIFDAAHWSAQKLRSLVTHNPVFMVRNALRDSQEGWLKGAHSLPILSALDGFRQVLTNSEHYQDLKRAGVVGGTLLEGGSSGTSLKLQRKLDIATGQANFAAKFWDVLGELTDASEAVGRVPAYEKSLKRNAEKLGPEAAAQAEYEALDMMNFSRHGRTATIRVASAIIPFLNAHLQGQYTLGRHVAGHAYGGDAIQFGGGGSKARQQLVLRGSMMATAAVGYSLMLADNDAWLNASPEERANNWFIPTGPGKPPIKIPLPFEMGFAFKTLPELMIANILKKDTNAQTRRAIATGIVSQLGMNPVPQLVKPPLENFFNYSMFKGRPIENATQQKLLPAYRSDQYTSELAKKAGVATGQSPMMIDNLMKGYSGTVGAAVLSMMDNMMREYKGEKPDTPIYQMPIIGSFLQRPDGARQVLDFYEAQSEIAKTAQTLKFLQSTDPASARKFYQEHKDKISLEPLAANTTKELTEFKRREQAIRDHPTFTGAQKRQLLDELTQRKLERAKQVNMKINKVTNQ